MRLMRLMRLMRPQVSEARRNMMNPPIRGAVFDRTRETDGNDGFDSFIRTGTGECQEP
jgi:hypothetical protein